jgi:spore coat protein U-like protein
MRRAQATPIAALALLGGLAAAPAHANTAPLTVQATVLQDCSIHASTLDFGDYVQGQAATTPVQSTIAYTNCSGNIVLSADGGGGGDVTARRMTNGSGGELAYQLYHTSTLGTVWGDGAGGGSPITFSILNSGNGQVSFYGQIPGDQTPPGGQYSDSVTVTLSVD